MTRIIKLGRIIAKKLHGTPGSGAESIDLIRGWRVRSVIFCALVLFAAFPRAWSQQLYSSDSGLFQLDTGFFLDWITTVEGVQTDDAETAELVGIFRAGKEAYNTGIATAQNKVIFRDQIFSAVTDELEKFLQNHPASAWAPSLHATLGTNYRYRGLYSRALIHWDAAWNQLKNAEKGVAKSWGDAVLAHYTRLLASLGRVEQLAEFENQYRTRILDHGPLTQKWHRTREAYYQMLAHPGFSYRCGTFALGNVARVLYGKDFPARELYDQMSPPEGFSVKALSDISDKLRLGLVPVVREKGNALVVPSVVHWKLNHYAAIVGQRESDGYYRVEDPTFEGFRYMSADAINEEASGVFLIPQRGLPDGWRVLTSAEAGQIFGRGNPNFQADPTDHKCPPDICCPPGGPGGGGGGGAGGAGGAGGGGSNGGTSGGNLGNKSGTGCSTCDRSLKSEGMATWWVSEPYINLWMQDTPMSYQPSVGPRVEFNLTYKQRNEERWQLPLTFNDWGTHAGNGWNSSWISYIEADFDQNIAVVLLPDGGFSTYDISGGTTTNYYTNFRLSYQADGSGTVTNFTLTFSDGRKIDYGQVALGNYFFMTKSSDLDGNALTFQYDLPYPYNNPQLARVIDQDGTTNTLNYAYGDPHLLSGVTGPYGTVSLEYDDNGYLTNITDVVGIESGFTYDEGGVGWPLSLTTPYGTTTFSLADRGVWWNGWTAYDRNAIIEDPQHSREMFTFVQDCSGFMATNYNVSQIPQVPVIGTLDTDTKSWRNSFHWNRAEYAALSTTNQDNFTANDYLRARMRHWLGDVPNDDGQVAFDTLSIERDQSPGNDGSGNPIEGQLTWYDYVGKGGQITSFQNDKPTQIMPAVVARRMPDTTTWYLWLQRDGLGRITNSIEKWTASSTDYYRTNRYELSTDGYDLIQHIGPNGELVGGYGYNAGHRVTSFTNAVGEVTSYTYSTDGRYRPILTTFPSGLISSNTYGSDGYLSNRVDYMSGSPLRTNSFTWQNAMPHTQIDSRGMTQTFTYDALNRLTRIDYPDSTYIQYGYTNGAGAKLLDRTYMKNRMGGQTYYVYDGLRRKIQEKDPRGNTTGFGYCSCGALEYVTNALSQVTHYSYDLQGHRVAIDYPNSTHTTNSFDLLGRLVFVSDALGKTTNTYDNLSRVIKVADAGGQKFAAVYDVEDRPTSVTDGNGVSVSQTFDDLGRIRTRTYPDSGVERFGYTALGLVKYTNQLNFITSYGYDAALRKTFETNANSEVLQFTYNAADDLRTLSDGKSQVTKWGYDIYGRATSKTNQANTQILTYAYDANSRLTNRWSSAKGNTKYTYDANGNVTFIDHPSSTDITYSYDGLNRLTNMVDAAGTTAFTYNSAGDLLTEDSPWSSDTVTYGYDSGVPHLRKSLSLQQPSGSWTNGYSYDAAHRLSSVTSQAGTYTYTYYTGSGGTASSRLYRKLALPNSSYITNAFDSVTRLTDTWLKNSGNTILNQHSYLNNAGNQRYKQTRTDASYVNYTYDNIGQLRSALGYTSGGTPISTEQKGYTYDAAWNLSARTNNGTTSTLTLDSQNQISSGLGSTFTWDNNGNRSTRSDNGTARYTYDDENQLVEVDKDPATYSSPPRTDYVYDGLGRMRKRTEYQWNGSIWNLQSETRYIYMGNLVIQERDGSNNPNVAYTRGNDLSGTTQGAEASAACWADPAATPPEAGAHITITTPMAAATSPPWSIQLSRSAPAIVMTATATCSPPAGRWQRQTFTAFHQSNSRRIQRFITMDTGFTIHWHNDG